ncbi:hypothetical protein IWW49_005362 [Coemansia sp. RSA 1797]|nr:hypothetical protein IWW49_005362 [Coemansia sp. RSA 1797]
MPHSPFNINTSEISEFKDRTGNTTLDDGDDSGAETSTVKSNEEADDWQAVAAKRSPHTINQNQEP